jgi:EAL domain-containing protein (putative c-di-GMP-specific phosphodiesterase class I)
MAEQRISLHDGMDLVRAIDEGQLFLDYQPVIDLRDERIVRFEALVRWHHPTEGRLLPEAFLPPLSVTGLAHELTLFVARTAATACAAWQDRAPGVGLSINVWPSDLGDPLLYEEAAATTDLTLEVVEVGGPVRLPEWAPSGRRVRVSIDDYGTGVASLARLRLGRIDELKLDRSLVQGLLHDRRARSIVESTVALARELGLALVVEGIEDEHTARVCVELGATLGQGFALGVSGDPAAHLAARR